MKNIMSFCASLLLLAMSYPAGAAILNATCGTVNGVIASAKAGDEIVLANGICNNLSIDFNPSESGTQSNPITLRPQTLFGVVFTGATRVALKKDYLVLDGFKFDRITWTSGGDQLIDVSGSSHSVIKRNWFYKVGYTSDETVGPIIRLHNVSTYNDIIFNLFDAYEGSAIQVYGYRDNDITNVHNRIAWNYFRDSVGGGNGSVMQIASGQGNVGPGGGSWDADYYTVIEYNYMENIDKNNSAIIQIKASHTTFRYNTIYMRATGPHTAHVDLRQGHDQEVYGNFLFGINIIVYDRRHKIYNNYIDMTFASSPSGDQGVRLGAGSTRDTEDNNVGCPVHKASDNIMVYNNTIIGGASMDTGGVYLGYNYNFGGLPGCLPWNKEPQDNEIRNNIVVNTAGRSYWDKASTRTVWSSNIAYPTGSGICGDCGTGVTQANPNFDTTQPYHIQAGSPAINNGADTSALVTDDMDGQPRDAKLDIGSDEFSSVSVARRPLTSADVGPGSPAQGTLPSDPQDTRVTVIRLPR